MTGSQTAMGQPGSLAAEATAIAASIVAEDDIGRLADPAAAGADAGGLLQPWPAAGAMPETARQNPHDRNSRFAAAAESMDGAKRRHGHEGGQAEKQLAGGGGSDDEMPEETATGAAAAAAGQDWQ